MRLSISVEKFFTVEITYLFSVGYKLLERFKNCWSLGVVPAGPSVGVVFPSR